MKKSLMFLLVFILALTASAVLADDLTDVMNSGTLRMGVPPEYIPFVFFDDAGNNSGIDVALIQEVGRRMGVKVQVVNLAFDGMMDSLNLGQVDVIGGAFCKTDERLQQIDFTRVYYSGNAQFIGLADMPIPQTVTLESYRNYKIGVQKGTSFEQWIKTNLVSAGYVSPRNVYTYSTAADEMRALDRRDVDVVLLTDDVYTDLYKNTGKYAVFYEGVIKEDYAFGLRKGSTLTSVINQHLNDMMKDGTAQSIANRFFSMNFNEVGVDTSRSSEIVLPTPVQPIYIVPTVSPAVSSCTNGMVFVSDVTITDGHQVAPGERFRKTWRVKNTGNCTWTSDYSFVYVSGDQMSGRNISVPAVVQPGQVVDLSVDLIAPNGNGTYRGYWQMRSPQGKNFGETIWVKVRVNGGAPVNPTPRPDGQTYKAINIEYFYPDYYAGEEGNCVRVYWKANGASIVEVTVDGTSMYKGDVTTGSYKLCGPITSYGSHNVQLYAFNVTTDAYSSFTYKTESAGGQKRVVPVIDYFYIDPDNGHMGDSATVYWKVHNAAGVTITVNGTTIENSSTLEGGAPVSSTIQIVGTSKIVLTAHSVTDDTSATCYYTMYEKEGSKKKGGDDGQKRVVPVIDYFYVDPDSGYMGDSATVYWGVHNAAGVTITVNGTTIENSSTLEGAAPVSSTIQKKGKSKIVLTAHSVTDDTSQTVYFTMREKKKK